MTYYIRSVNIYSIFLNLSLPLHLSLTNKDHVFMQYVLYNIPATETTRPTGTPASSGGLKVAFKSVFLYWVKVGDLQR